MGLLPKQPTPPKTELGDFKILLWGPPKIGKSTTASQFPGAVFLATEDGQRALSCYRVPVDSWLTFLAACRELASGGHDFKTVVVDTIGNLHSLCRRHICRKLGVEHEADAPFGRGYVLVQDEFERALTELSRLPLGLLLIGHSEAEEAQTRTGTLHRVVPALPARPRRFILGLVDIVLYATLIPERGPDGKTVMRRVVRTHPNDSYEAGDRTGRLPDPIDLDYERIAAAFAAANVKEESSD